MFDTSVLVEAIQAALDLGSTKNQLAALHAVESAELVVVSAITHFELEYGFDETQRKVASRWGIRVEVVDAAIARRGAQLLRVAQADPKICDRCFGIIPPEACTTCGGQATKQRKTNDALIVATAELRSDIDHLYTTDGGMLYLAKFTKGVVIAEPPPPPDATLELPFPKLEEPTPIEQPKKAPSKKGGRR